MTAGRNRFESTIALDSASAFMRALSSRGDNQFAPCREGTGNACQVLEDGMWPFASSPVVGNPSLKKRPQRRTTSCAPTGPSRRKDDPPAPRDTAQTSFGLPHATAKTDMAAARQIEEELAALRRLIGAAD